MSNASTVFRSCVLAIREGELIERQVRSDKEFHFQNWFRKRLEPLGLAFDPPGRNTFPDFRLVQSAEGFELKGLAYPGREADYDANSQVPCGSHNGRSIYYVFGRYPSSPDGDSYPVLDLVVCHGDFLNADSGYLHQNKSFRGFGSYGDILVRDRKMYVAPTPFALVEGAAHHRTLIVPESDAVDADMMEVGTLVRREVDRIVVAYSFDLSTNDLSTIEAPNAHAGREHRFKAYRLPGDPSHPVALRERSELVSTLGSEETASDGSG